MQLHKIAYFGSDASDTATRRRISQISRSANVTAFTFSRRRFSSFTPDWENVDLGYLQDGHYLKRCQILIGSVAKVIAQRAKLVGVGLVIARNLDILALAYFARAIGLYRAPIAYEVLDVRGVLLGTTLKARAMRAIEKFLISKCALLVVSSQGFIDEYFHPIQSYNGKYVLLENKVDLETLPNDAKIKDAWRADDRARQAPAEGRFVLGWIGALRCARSADLLRDIALALPWLTVRISGKPTYCDEALFRANFSDIPNVEYTGEYPFPTGLYEVYRAVDLVWNYDLSKVGTSGRWLLPNRLYEGGYFGVPHLAETGSETAAYVSRLGIGWERPAELEQIIAFLNDVIGCYAPVKQRCLDVMNDNFHYRDDIRHLLEAATVNPVR